MGRFVKGQAAHNRTHGMSETKLYGVWLAMKRRCDLPTTTMYRYYGGRGITVCRAWRESFESFLAWSQANGYAPGLTIERKNNDGNYTPRNCCWIPRSAQSRNRGDYNHIIDTPHGKMLLSEAERAAGLSRCVIASRIKHGWPVSKLFAPKGYRHWNRWRPRPGRVDT